MATGIYLLAIALFPCCKHETVSWFILTIPFHEYNINIQLSLRLSGSQESFFGRTFIQCSHWWELAKEINFEVVIVVFFSFFWNTLLWG